MCERFTRRAPEASKSVRVPFWPLSYHGLMKRADLINRLRTMRPWLASYGVQDISLFGSFARDEARSDSDVDLLVTFDPQPGLAFFTLERELSARLGRLVELSTPEAMHPLVRERALAEAVRV